jgi:integrase
MKRGDGVYQRQCGYWYFKAKIDGVWKERSTGTTVYADARAIRTDFLRQLKDGTLPNERSLWTLEQTTRQHLADRELRISRGSYLSEVTICKTLKRILGDNTRMDKLADRQVIRRYETTRLREDISPKTINNEVLVLAAMLREAKLWVKLRDDYKKLHVRRSDVPDALSAEEAKRLLAYASTAQEDAVAPYAAVLAYSTGMRSREIKYLTLGSIHLDTPTPYIQVKRSSTKTDAGARKVALDQIAIWALRKLLDRGKRKGSIQPTHYLLPTRLDRHTRASDPLKGGTGWDPTHPQTSWDVEWDDLRKKTGLTHRRFHDLRHSYVTRAAEANVPVLVIQQQVGHLSRQMTEHYCHVSHAALHQAAQQIQANSSELLAALQLKGAVN